ncbi:unnamed protein product, partial [Didymodactylos carnosus]
VVTTCSALKSPSPDYYKQPSSTISQTLSSSISNTNEASNESQEIVGKSPSNAQSLLDEVMQAFSEIYVDDTKKTDSIANDETVLERTADINSSSNNHVGTNGLSHRPPAKLFRTEQQQDQTTYNFQLGHISPAESIHTTDNDPNSRSPSTLSKLLPKLTLKKSNDSSCRFSRELEQRLQNGDELVVSEEAKNAYDLLINGCRSASPTSPTHSHIPDSSTPLFLRSRCTSGDLEHHQQLQQQGPTSDIQQEILPHQSTSILFGSSSSSSNISLSTTSSSRLQNNSKNLSSVSNSSSSSANVAPIRSYHHNDRNSHYSATSTDNDVSIDLQNGEHHTSTQQRNANHPLFIATGGGNIKSPTQLTVSTDTRDNCSASPLRLLRSGGTPSLLPKPIRQQQHQQPSSSLLQAQTCVTGTQLLTPSSSNSNTLDNSHNHNDSNGILIEDNLSLSNSSTSTHSFSSSHINHPMTTISVVNNIGQQLPPPPDLSSLGSKLTTATTLHTLKLPLPIPQTTSTNHYRTKKRFNLFAS